MLTIEDNIFNRGLSPDQPKFKLWHSAGLMLTYRCPSRCACCYVYSGPEAGDSLTEMSVERALMCWRGVLALAGPRGKVHITGGEPFCNYERLKAILQVANKEQLGGLEKIETNAYWCTDEEQVRQRLDELKELGLNKLQISTDVYHQEYIPFCRVQLAVRVGREVLGEAGVQVRWRDFLAEPVLVSDMSSSDRAGAFTAALASRRERLLGRAADELVSLFPSRSYVDFTDNNCKRFLLGAGHVHIDGMGNVFIGTCAGIIAARAGAGEEGTLDEIWRDFDYRRHPVFGVLVEKGPVGLMLLAVELGYRPLSGYADKCHLCYDVRRFLYTNGEYSTTLGPGPCYGDGQKCRHQVSGEDKKTRGV